MPQNTLHLDQLRLNNPLVHNITNIVSAHFSANGLLALGASPIMSGVYDEMVQLAQISDALALNLGAQLVNRCVR